MSEGDLVVLQEKEFVRCNCGEFYSNPSKCVRCGEETVSRKPVKYSLMLRVCHGGKIGWVPYASSNCMEWLKSLSGYKNNSNSYIVRNYGDWRQYDKK